MFLDNRIKAESGNDLSAGAKPRGTPGLIGNTGRMTSEKYQPWKNRRHPTGDEGRK